MSKFDDVYASKNSAVATGARTQKNFLTLSVSIDMRKPVAASPQQVTQAFACGIGDTERRKVTVHDDENLVKVDRLRINGVASGSWIIMGIGAVFALVFGLIFVAVHSVEPFASIFAVLFLGVMQLVAGGLFIGVIFAVIRGYCTEQLLIKSKLTSGGATEVIATGVTSVFAWRRIQATINSLKST
ncbi:MAG: hypothetical protein FWD65_02595 [Coriobacteriia bacterium]|nr:hypothetical protein [Coriobacteriia bacterium]